MENRNNILSELQSISPTLAEIVPVTPYEVPRGYFEGLAATMLQLVNQKEGSAVLINAGSNPYKVPDDYFENLPGQILSLIKNDEVSLLLKDAGKNPYEVPQGYFDELADQILSRVKALETETLSAKEELEVLSPLLSKLDKKLPFSTPAGYFDELTANVIGGMNAIDFVNEELENLSPLMSSLKTKNVYTVPDQYFESLPAAMLNRLKEKKTGKLVQINFGKKWMRYATAAVVAGLIITAGFLFLNKPGSTVTPGTIVLAEEKLQQETQKKVEGLSDDEIFNFLENQTAPLPDFLNLVSSPDIDSDDVKMMLADIPDAELNQYLVEYSDTKELLTN
ncbi:MAG: hypothetical protein H7122_04720 [Chitinophagaceae bacterium]|nr:hypothetical protein [Chitinophagaceae bacterium]